MPAIPAIRLPEVDVSDVDVSRTLTDVAVATGLRPARRTRVPFAIVGLIVAGTAAWAVMNSQQLRDRLAGLATSVRERVASMRSSEWDQADPVAFPAAETKPIQPESWDRGEDTGAPDYPEGLGSNNGDRMPDPRESATPV